MARALDALLRIPRWAVWLLAAIPLALLIRDLLTGQLGVDPIRDIEHRLGRTALYFLIGSLCFTPALRLFRVNLMRFRRPVGLIAFSYAVLHVSAWVVLDMGLLWEQLLRDIAKRPYLTLGMAAFAILALMAATSANRIVRRLGPVRWRSLHRLVYAAAPLAALHWLLSHKIWPTKGIAVGLVILGLLAFRLPVVRDATTRILSKVRVLRAS